MTHDEITMLQMQPEPKHTPGPWTVGNDGAPIVLDSDGYTVAGMFSRVDDGMEEANARLIASAPDLLAALQQIVNGNGSLYDLDATAMRAALAAIDKAL